MAKKSYMQTIFQFVSRLPDVRFKADGDIELRTGGKAIVRLNNENLIAFNQNLTQKFSAKNDRFDIPPLLQEWEDFLTEIKSSYIRLNHLGISYACDRTAQEIAYYRNIVSELGCKLYEEPSQDMNARWLFAGDVKNWQKPMFEIVLTFNKTNPENDWRPHFHIDIDTGLSKSELTKQVKKYFGPDFIKWKIDIPGYGEVLLMGMLGSVAGTKIYLGVGTSLRNTQYHRQNELMRL